MAWHWAVSIAGFVVSAGAAILMAVFVLYHRARRGSRPLAVLAIGAAVWAVANALQIASPSVEAMLFWGNLKYLGIVALPAGWLLFSLAYTGRGQWVTPRFVALLSIEPVLVLALVWTNPDHYLFLGPPTVESFGAVITVLDRPSRIGFGLHVIYSYVLLLAGTLLVLEMAAVTAHVYRYQSVALLVGVFVPWAMNAASLLGVGIQGIDYTPIGFTVSAIALSSAVYRYDLRDLVPVTRETARNELINSIADAVLVVDDEGRIADVNPQAESLLGLKAAAAVGTPIAEAVPELADVVPADDEVTTDRVQVTIERGGVSRHFDVRVSPVSARVTLGALVILRDVTEQERQRQRLSVLNRVLRHDLRNEMNVVLALAQDVMDRVGDDDPEVFAHAHQIKERGLGLVGLSEKARDLEETISAEDVVLHRIDLVDVLESVTADVAERHPDVEVTRDVPESAPVYASDLIDAAVENVLQNAIEHNDHVRPRVDIAIEDPDGSEFVTLTVADNGPGVPEEEREVLSADAETQLHHSSGIGLWLINWIVTESGGRISFEPNQPRGSVTKIELLAADATLQRGSIATRDVGAGRSSG